MRWTLQQVADALGIPAPAGADPLARLAGVSIDSRTLGAGELFFAIHGPRHDGHDFVAAALAAGAPAAVVARARAVSYADGIRGRLLVVDDTAEALRSLARAVRRAWSSAQPRRRLAGITGSAGKTTTKEILAALLRARLSVLKSEGNLNNEYGLPLTLLRLEEGHEAAVTELGMNHRGEIARLAQIAEPEVGVVTCVAPVHLEFFSSLEEIALAKRELIEGLTPQGVAVLNADDEHVARFGQGFAGTVLTFGFAPGAQFRAANVQELGVDGAAFDFCSPGETSRLHLALPGSHNVRNALAALAAASVWGIGAREAAEVFPRLAPAAMRGQVLRFAEGFTVINDAYNSNPVALASNIDLLAAAPAARRILAAGEMLELGPSAPELHRQAGAYAAKRHVDWILGVRGNAAAIVEGAVAAGHPAAQAQFFESAEDAGKFLCGFLSLGDVLLVKGSRGVKMERVLEEICARHQPAQRGEA